MGEWRPGGKRFPRKATHLILEGYLDLRPVAETHAWIPFQTVEQVHQALENQAYISERSLEVAIFLAAKLSKPLFLEGEAGVGKTEVAKVLARILQTKLIRLQCYEGLDVSTALYEWNYARQLLHIRLLESAGASRDQMRENVFSREFLLARPLLQAVEASRDGTPPVLLIDEIDRADEEFEAFLLELLSDFQVTIPEIGAIQAKCPPVVVVTSNRTREVHDALKRRCLYHWIDYPSLEKELAIVQVKAPDLQPAFARQIALFVQELRRMDLFKAPGVAETLDWTAALVALDQRELSLDLVEDTIGVLLKYQDDISGLSRDSLRMALDRVRMAGN